MAEQPAAAVPDAPAVTEPDLDFDPPATAVEAEGADGAGPVAFEMIGLAPPETIAVKARLGLFNRVALDSAGAGIYRPLDFRAAPWSGFAYDAASDTRSGISAGSRIMTNRGEVAMKDLMPGDEALCLRGPRLRRITWIGRRTSGPVVAFAPGSLGEDLPRAPLFLAAEQPVFLEAVPVTAAKIAEQHGGAVSTEEAPDLFQICVGHDEVVLAEGVPIAVSASFE